MFYIGSTSIKRINSGYRGSVLSRQYKDIWKSELNKNPHLFKTIIISEHQTRHDALNKEEKLQRTLKVLSSPMYINMCYANCGFGGGMVGKDNPMFGKTRSDASVRMKHNNPMKNPEIAKKVSKNKKGKPSKMRGSKNPNQTKRLLENNPMKNPVSIERMLAKRKPEDSGKGQIWIANIYTKKRTRIDPSKFDDGMINSGWVILSNRLPIPD